MNLSSPFIHRPIATTLLAVGLAIAGIVAFNVLPVASLPEMDFPTINVQASLPGASPENMATSVATPLERQLGWIAGITQMTSTSTLGSSQITVQFDLTRNIDGAARDVQAAINAARSQLPPNLPTNPSYRKINPADSPILILALTSDVYTRGQMYDAASTILQQKLSQVEGVGQVYVGGSSLPAVRIELNPRQLEHYGLSLQEIAAEINAASANRPKGQIEVSGALSDIVANDQLFTAKQYKSLIIAYRNGRALRLSSVANVVDSVENVRNAGIANNKPSVLLVLFKQPGSNVLKTVQKVNAALPQLEAAIPAAMKIATVMDRTTTIKASLLDVELTLLIALVLVVMVTYLFLGSIRAMIVPGVAVLLSLLGTFGVMSLLHYSLDNLSLMALTISTGFVIDDAIVVLENISRHLEQGMKPIQAALEGAKEVGFTVLSMSTSLIAVFTPILLMGGLVGRLFREFAVTLSVAILVSLVVSLTVTPMMCAHLLKKEHFKSGEQATRYHRWVVKAHYAYERSLNWALSHVKLMLLITAAAIVLNVVLFIKIPKGFFPQQDTGRIAASLQADQNSSFQFVEKKLRDYVKIIKEDPAVENVVGYVGSSTANAGMVYVTLKELAQRKISIDEVIVRLRNKLKVIKGANLYMQAAQDLVVGGRLGNAQFQYTLSADSLEDLNLWTPRVLARLSKLSGVADINSDQLDGGLQEFVNVDRDTASRLGFTMQQIDQALYDAFGQNQISTFYTPMNQYRVVMEAAPSYWQYPSVLNSMYLVTADHKSVPLSALSRHQSSATLLSVNHQGQAPSATLSFNLLPGYALGDAVSKIERVVASMHLPATIQATFQGTAQAFQASLASEPYLILVALIAIYIVLGILYESVIHPITILSTLPSAGVGALLALIITHTDLSIIALIGVILLIGIVKKNAIMMIDFALQIERGENKNSRKAIYEAAVLRFRPIMMTTMAAILGALPLALGHGVGAELRRPLGIAIIGGLIVSQMLTLYTTPVIYLELERFVKWCKRK